MSLLKAFISLNSKNLVVKLNHCRTYARLSYIHNVGSEPLKYLTVGQLLQLTANKYPDREAVVSRYQNQRVTYQDVLKQADKLAAGFQALGLKKGDRLGLWAPNSVEWVVTMMASARTGLILVLLNPAYRAKEVEYSINKVGIQALVCPDKVKKLHFYDILNEVESKLPQCEPGKLKSEIVPSLKSIITTSDETVKGTYNYNEVLQLASEMSVKNIGTNQPLIQPDNPLYIQFTSGTTGQPKAAIASHFHLVNNSFQIGKRNELNKMHHKICNQVPFFHAYGTVVTLGAALNFGATIVVPSPIYNSRDNLNAIKEEDCTIIHGTPTMYVDLINVQNELQAEINPQIAVAAGAPCSPELFRQMQNTLKVKRVKSIYGLTEATAAVFHSLPVEEGEHKSTATVGYVSEHLEVKVVDDNNNIVPLETPGELYVRGYSTMLGYWNDENKTKEIMTADRWLRTGDQFVLQEDGYGRIVGRLKDMIIRGGENIFPKEIEDVLNEHPDILESYVVGLAHERLGEEVCACVRLRNGTQLSLESLVKFCEKQLARFKIPTQLKILENFPKTESGKIQKYLLKEQLEKLKTSHVI